MSNEEALRQAKLEMIRMVSMRLPISGVPLSCMGNKKASDE